jgi:hypothetical protein
LVCHPPDFRYIRTGPYVGPLVTLDLSCCVVSVANCDPEKYEIGSHQSGTEELIPDSVGLEQAGQMLEQIKNGPNYPSKEEDLRPFDTGHVGDAVLSRALEIMTAGELRAMKPLVRSNFLSLIAVRLESSEQVTTDELRGLFEIAMYVDKL